MVKKILQGISLLVKDMKKKINIQIIKIIIMYFNLINISRTLVIMLIIFKIKNSLDNTIIIRIKIIILDRVWTLIIEEMIIHRIKDTGIRLR